MAGENTATPAASTAAPVTPDAAKTESAPAKTDGVAADAKTEVKVETKAETPPVKDPKAIHAEQERRLEIRATAIRAELAKRDQDLKARAATLEKQEASLKELAAFKEAKAAAKDDPISFLEANGLTFEDVAKAAASGTGADPAARKALKEARELRAKLEEKEKAETEAQKKTAESQNAERKKQTISTIDQMLKSDKKYRYAAELGSADDVFDAWFARYQKTGKMPDVHEVAAKVNEFYKEQATRARKVLDEENPPAKPPEPAVVVKTTEPEPPVAVHAPKKLKSIEPEASDDLRGRKRSSGRGLQAEIEKQLEEVRKSRA